jgi:hypothetical protein
MKRLIQIISLTTGVMVLCMFMLSGALALTSPVTISLVTSKSAYQAAEAIKMQIQVMNTSGGDVIAQEGFFQQHFYLKITFISPDGKPVYTKYQDVGQEGGPPLRFQDKDAVLVETIQVGASRTDILEDARTFYNITKYGHWKAQVVAFLETYSAATTDPNTGKLIAYLEDQTGSYEVKSNAATFDIVSSVPAVKSSIQVDVNLHIIGTGTKPPVKKQPLDGVSVRLYSRASLAQYEPANWKAYPLIWNNNSIAPVQVKPTNSQGIATFEQVDKNDYVVITSYDSLYAGSPIDSADTEWATGTLQKHLSFMQKADNSKVPGKTTVQKGSLLLIIEPEYIEWDSTQELYPFVFETIGDWGVSTAIAPPEGFVTDYGSLSIQVKDSTGAVQFNVKDIGSRWVDTGVTFTVTHKKKVKTLKDKVGIKLAKKLADKKGLSVYGETGSPGTFSGGKKIGQ